MRFLPILLLLAACDPDPVPTLILRPPTCLFMDAAIPAPEVRSADPAVFFERECHLVKTSCDWVCSHDGVHVVYRHDEEACREYHPETSPFMRLGVDGRLTVIQ